MSRASPSFCAGLPREVYTERVEGSPACPAECNEDGSWALIKKAEAKDEAKEDQSALWQSAVHTAIIHHPSPIFHYEG
jgi:hypothetical protein